MQRETEKYYGSMFELVPALPLPGAGRTVKNRLSAITITHPLKRKCLRLETQHSQNPKENGFFMLLHLMMF